VSINRYRPHVLILPEDDANRQIANGFIINSESSQIQIENNAGGWLNVCSKFLSNYVEGMAKYPGRHVILIVDFDDDADRFDAVRRNIENQYLDRVFILGVKPEPEDLKRALSTSFEAIGKQMAKDCHGGSGGIWDDSRLNHNADELTRMCAALGDFFVSK
jgi:hypothetical protein